MQLPQGDYGMVLRYEGNEDAEAAIYLDKGGPGYPVFLPKDQTEVEIPVYLDSYKDSVHFEFTKDPGNALSLNGIHVYSTRIIYADFFYLAFLFAAGAMLLYRIFYPAASRSS